MSLLNVGNIEKNIGLFRMLLTTVTPVPVQAIETSLESTSSLLVLIENCIQFINGRYQDEKCLYNTLLSGVFKGLKALDGDMPEPCLTMFDTSKIDMESASSIIKHMADRMTIDEEDLNTPEFAKELSDAYEMLARYYDDLFAYLDKHKNDMEWAQLVQEVSKSSVAEL